MTIRELYDAVGGDYDDFLKRIPREDLIGKLVVKYARSERFAELFAAYEAKDYKKVFDVSHTIKGMAANISFTEARNTMSEICEAVRNGEPKEDIGPLLKTAETQYRTLLELLPTAKL